MKRIKQGLIDPKNLISKAAYAREIGVSPPAVDKMVNKGYVTIVKFKGGEVIHKQ